MAPPEVRPAPKPARAEALAGFRARYGRVLEVLVGGLLVVMFVEVTAGVVFRTVGHALAWYDEIASVLLAWLTFYGSALASVRRAHIGCPELVDQFPPGARRTAAIVVQLVVIAFFVTLGYVGATIMPVLAGDTMVSLPWMPMNVVQSVIPISSVLIVIAEGAYLLELLAGPPASGEAPVADALH